MANEGSLFVVVLGTILNQDDRQGAGLAVDLMEGGIVPLGALKEKFIVSKCTTFANKPKVFAFIDTKLRTEGLNATMVRNVCGHFSFFTTYLFI
jgi:hypothetical protein